MSCGLASGLQEHFGCEASRSGGTFCASRHRVRPRRGHPVTLCICLIYGVQVFLWRGDEHVAAELIEGLIAVAEKHSLAPYHACNLVRSGELLVARGETAAGVEHLRRARAINCAKVTSSAAQQGCCNAYGAGGMRVLIVNPKRGSEKANACAKHHSDTGCDKNRSAGVAETIRRIFSERG